jgi:rhodanese-related sulfurtransferase
MRNLFTLAALVAALMFVGCQSASTKKTDSPAIVAEMGVSEITPQQARPGVEAAYSQFIDVRTPEEFAVAHAYRTRNIPLDQLKDNLDKLEKNEPVYLICQSGRRSKQAAEILIDAGFTQAISIAGGTNAWKEAGLPMADTTGQGTQSNSGS